MENSKKTYHVMEVQFRDDGDWDIVYSTGELSYKSALVAYRDAKKYAHSVDFVCLSSETEDGDGTILYKHYMK